MSDSKNKVQIKFNHAGNFGDIVFSLPFCIKTAADRNADKFDFHLQIEVPGKYVGTHPCGNVMMTSGVAGCLKPLLEKQPYINEVTISKLCPDGYYDLGKFRSLNHISLASGSIAQWYNVLSYSMLSPPDIWNPWLFVNENDKVDLGEKRIVLFRSSRYHRKGLDYSFLKKFKNIILFIGLEQEKEAFEDEFSFKVDYHRIEDFYEAARIMASAKLVIGNQTGLFSIAEAMKVNRLLETAYICPNVVMLGGNAQYIIQTAQFKEVFNSFLRAFIC